MWEFREWVRDSIAQNKPYDKFVYELLTARAAVRNENPTTGAVFDYLRFAASGLGS
jgi:hypothetical protein